MKLVIDVLWSAATTPTNPLKGSHGGARRLW